jgi:hypothetical protein
MATPPRGRVRIALGPIKLAFSGETHVTMDAAKREGKWPTVIDEDLNDAVVVI